MTINEIKGLVVTHCLNHSGTVNPNVSRLRWWSDRNLEYLKEAILEATHFATDCKLTHRISMIALGITDRPGCKVCNSATRWRYDLRMFSTYCSVRCSSKDTLEKRKTTNLEKYGVDNYSKSTSFLEKSKATFIQKYGVDNPAKDPTVIAKIKDAFSSYSGGHPLRDPVVKAKAVQAAIDKYGCHHTQRHVDPEKLKLLDDYAWLKEFLRTNTVSQLAKYVGMSHSNTGTKLKAHGLYTEVSSGFQAEVLAYLKTFIHESDIQVNIRSLIHPFEIDIYVPAKQIAIECNGTYWHSDLNGRGKEYHLNKSELLKAKGIHLIHIWEHEWNANTDLVQSRIQAKLGYSSVMYARNCSIVEVSDEAAFNFLNTNHIQGYCTASIRFGLIHNDSLIALMTFGKSRYDKSVEWELIRYCTSHNISVTGGASRLLKHFVKLYSPSSIVSYSAKEWNSGNLYSKLGFSLVSTSPPAYYYTDDYVTFHNRVSFQKHKLKDKLALFDPAKTEWENMKDNGYDRIWDCGSDKWIIRY